jgi:hypothetical protein
VGRGELIYRDLCSSLVSRSIFCWVSADFIRERRDIMVIAGKGCGMFWG